MNTCIFVMLSKCIQVQQTTRQFQHLWSMHNELYSSDKAKQSSTTRSNIISFSPAGLEYCEYWNVRQSQLAVVLVFLQAHPGDVWGTYKSALVFQTMWQLQHVATMECSKMLNTTKLAGSTNPGHLYYLYYELGWVV